MSSVGLSSITDLVALLSVPPTGQWNIANTDNKAPIVTDNLETPWEELGVGGKPYVYVKYDTEAIKTGMYALEFFHKVLVAIEVMSPRVGEKGGKVHFEKLVNETVRIIKANPRRVGYFETIVRSTGPPRFVKDRGMFLCPIEVEAQKVKTS